MREYCFRELFLLFCAILAEFPTNSDLINQFHKGPANTLEGLTEQLDFTGTDHSK